MEGWSSVSLRSAKWLVERAVVLVFSTARDWCWELLIAFVGSSGLSVDILWSRLSGSLLSCGILGPRGMRRSRDTSRDVWYGHLRRRNVVCELVVDLNVLMVVLLWSRSDRATFSMTVTTLSWSW